MDLYTKEMIPQIAKDACRLNEATLSDVQAYVAERGMVAVPTELLHALQSLVIECRDEQPMDFDPLDALNTRILAARGSGTP
jgi:hypothetical protein